MFFATVTNIFWESGVFSLYRCFCDGGVFATVSGFSATVPGVFCDGSPVLFATVLAGVFCNKTAALWAWYLLPTYYPLSTTHFNYRLELYYLGTTAYYLVGIPTYDLRPTTYTTTSATSEPLQETPVNQQRRHKHPPLSQRRKHLVAENTKHRKKHHYRRRKQTPLPLQKTPSLSQKTPFTVAESPSSRSNSLPPTGTKNTFPRNSCKTQVTSKTRSPHGRCPRLFSKRISWDWAKTVHVPNGKRQFRCEVGMPLSTFAVSSSVLRLALVSFSLSSFSVFWMNETKWNKMK